MKAIYPIDHFNIEDNHEIGHIPALFGELSHSHVRVLTSEIIPHEIFSSFLKEHDLDRKINALLESAVEHTPELFQNTSLLIARSIQNVPIKESILTEISHSLRKHTSVEHVCLHSDIIPFKATHDQPTESHEIRINQLKEIESGIKQLWVELFSPARIKKYLEKQMQFADFYNVISVQPIHNWQASVMTYYDKKSREYVVTALPGEQRDLFKRSKTNQLSLDTLIVEGDSLNIAKITTAHPKTKGKYNGIHFEETAADDTYLEQQVIPQVGSLILKHKEIIKTSPSTQLCEWRLYNKQWLITNIYSFSQFDIETPEANTEILAYGKSIFPGLVTGNVRILETQTDVDTEKLSSEDIVIISNVPANKIELLNKARALIIENTIKDEGYVSQRISIPTVSEVKNARGLLKKFSIVTVNASAGQVTAPNLIEPHITPENRSVVRLQAKQPILDEQPINTATKLLTEVSSNAHLDRIRLDFVDGVIFHPEEVLAEISVHPKRLSSTDKTKMKHLLHAELAAIAQKTFPKPLFYHLSHFSSELLRHFKYGELEEKEELNPSTGFNGLTRIVIDKLYLPLELEIIKSIRNDFGLLNVHLVIPAPRSVTEVTALKRYLNTQKMFNSPSTKQYLEIWVPENLFRIHSYIAAGVQNFIVDTDKLIAALYNFDLSNETMVNKLVFDEEFVSDVLQEFLETIRTKNGETVLKIGHLIPQENIIDLAVKMGVRALISADTAVRVQKEHISKSEFKLLKER